MNRPRMTSAASALNRALLDRAKDTLDRIILSDWVTTDWQSLTFTGERHRAGFVVHAGAEVVERWAQGLADAEFDLGPAGFVAEIALCGPPAVRQDGALQVELEALTIAD